MRRNRQTTRRVTRPVAPRRSREPDACRCGELVQAVDRLLEAAVDRLVEAMEKQGRLIRAAVLTGGPGKPRHPRVSLAAAMRAEGKPWGTIYRKALRPPALYESPEHYQATKIRLRRAVAQRVKRGPLDPLQNHAVKAAAPIQ